MSEELIREINGIIGALDGKTLARVKRLVRLLHSYEWATGELSILCQHWDEEYRRGYLEYIRNKLKETIEKENEILKKSGGNEEER